MSSAPQTPDEARKQLEQMFPHEDWTHFVIVVDPVDGNPRSFRFRAADDGDACAITKGGPVYRRSDASRVDCP